MTETAQCPSDRLPLRVEDLGLRHDVDHHPRHALLLAVADSLRRQLYRHELMYASHSGANSASKTCSSGTVRQFCNGGDDAHMASSTIVPLCGCDTTYWCTIVVGVPATVSTAASLPGWSVVIDGETSVSMDWQGRSAVTAECTASSASWPPSQTSPRQWSTCA